MGFRGVVAGAISATAGGGVRAATAGRRIHPDTDIFAALRAGELTAGWTGTADTWRAGRPRRAGRPQTRADPGRERRAAVRRNELTISSRVRAINEVAGVLDTGSLVDMRRQVAGGGDPQAVAEGWLAAHPLALIRFALHRA